MPRTNLKVEARPLPGSRVQTPRRTPPPSADAVYLSVAQIRERFGGVSQMWVERKIAGDPSFPRPIKFGGKMFRFFLLSELVEWERSAATKG